jgi:uncharacterized cofD-like protein
MSAPRIVCIGGGTGLHNCLLGLKAVLPEAELAAVVTMMDSGGSTGRLRDEFGFLPPGDVRRCLIALSDAPLELRKLMQHRFDRGNGLSGHVVGNLLLTALKEIHGDEYAAIAAMERILAIKGKVYPVTLTDCTLVAELEDGTRVHGESNIDLRSDARMQIRRVLLEPSATLFGRTSEAIKAADYIIIGPGDLYTSVMPNLAVRGMAGALAHAQARGARILFVTNTMTKRGETDGFTASDFVRVVQEALGTATLDAVIVNTGQITLAQREAYARERAVPVVDDLKRGGAILVEEDLVRREDYARHHPHKLAQAVRKAISALGRPGTATAPQRVHA